MKLLSALGLVLLCTVAPVYAITCADVTCDEARNYPQMDRDNDGYYCEAQCGKYTPSKKPETKPTIEPKKTSESKKTTTKPATPKKAENEKTKTKKNSKYITGPKGGCYYLNTKKKKVYVDKKYCN